MRAFFLGLLLVLTGLPAHADLAISIRYFKSVGVSHYHLYLYGDDGKVIRQLTAPEDAHDTDPIFSPDGSEIVFKRVVQSDSKIMSIRPDGTGLRTLAQAPKWYRPALDNDAIAYQLSGGGDNDPLWQVRGAELVIAVPDGKTELVLKNADNFKLREGHEAHSFDALTIRNVADGKETRVPTFGDREGAYCDLATLEKSPFFLRGGLRFVFYWQWGGSTAGPRLGVLDLDKKKATFLSENPAIAVPHGTRSGFFTVTEHRYQPLPGTKKTVNCLYLEWWNADLKRTRFARPISFFGSASVRVKGQPSLDIPVKWP